MKARDAGDRLLCQYPDGFLTEGLIRQRPLKPCGAKISGTTGLQELENLGAHLRRKHLIQGLTIERLLDIRARWEDNERLAGSADDKAARALSRRAPGGRP